MDSPPASPGGTPMAVKATTTATTSSSGQKAHRLPPRPATNHVPAHALAFPGDVIAGIAVKRKGRPPKRGRLDWPPEMQTRFIETVKQIGADNATPTKIMEIMGMPQRQHTRHHVAAQLQRYRYHARKETPSVHPGGVDMTVTAGPPPPSHHAKTGDAKDDSPSSAGVAAGDAGAHAQDNPSSYAYSAHALQQQYAAYHQRQQQQYPYHRHAHMYASEQHEYSQGGGMLPPSDAPYGLVNMSESSAMQQNSQYQQMYDVWMARGGGGGGGGRSGGGGAAA
uniref:HTH myb-type domain-containing protein n=2 Tax=Pycnococcus provasolii TaxID=41880 RepID=A0A7S2YWU4_9CHLO|mmetsp:Transcript_2619/g.6583  ORF Transcript_2619/g.6583 Transcript_2619/m.6583 type:complete len:280 (+) Transcript_2619:832-1671(+)